MSSSKQQPYIGGAFVHKELQGFAAFVAYQECHHSGNSVTKTMMEASIAEQHFGNARDRDSIGLAEQLVGGIGIFGGLNYRSGTSSDYLTPVCHDYHTTNPPPLLNTTTTRSSLVMKPSLHCLGGQITIPIGGINGISLPLLLQSKVNTTASNPDDYIKPRTLYTRALEVVKNGKKALSCVMAPDSPYRDYITTGNLPLGMNHDDYLQFVREKMYFVLNPSKQCDDVSANTSSRNTTSSTHNADNAAPTNTAMLGSTIAGLSTAPLRKSSLDEGEPGNCKKKLNASVIVCHQTTTVTMTVTTAPPDLLGLATIGSMPAEDRKRTSSIATLGERLQAAGIAQSRLAHKGKAKAKLNDRIVAMHLKR